MENKREILLYTRPDCHLCELATQMLMQSGVTWHEVDVESDLDLIRKFGNHIPVLYRTDVDRELFWPFSPQTVNDFLDLEI